MEFRQSGFKTFGAFAAASAVALTGAMSATASAQDRQEDVEIIVTALKRDQRLQDAPVSVTAFTAARIEDAGITRPIDFINSTPNLSAVEANNAGDLRITVRGDAQALNTDAPVAVVIDGVLLTGATGLNKDLLDVQQIEVLKGPQGYLYGRNAISGAINIVTKAPGDTFEGEALVGYGNGETARAALSVSGPIIPGVLAASVSTAIRDSEGFYDNITLGKKVDPYTEKSGRVRVDWTPNEDLRIQASAFSSRIDGSATNYFSQSVIGVAPTVPGTPIDADYANHTFVYNVDNFNRKEDDLYAVRIDYSRPWGTITSVTSKEEQDNIFASDGFPYTPGTGEGTQYNRRQHSALTQEIRFTSPSENAFRYIVGAYYADITQEPFLLAAVGVDDIGRVLAANRPRLSGSNATTGFSADNVESEAWAVFANADWDFNPQWTLTLAGRYDAEDKSATDVAPPGFSATSGAVRTRSFSQFQPKVSLAWRPSEDLSFYATYAEGYKAGGFNAAQAATITSGAAPNDYPAETAKNFEIGGKSQTFDGALTLNGAIFHTIKENSQLFRFIPTGFLNAVTVIDEITVNGVEVESTYAFDNGLTLRGGVGYVDAEITDYRGDRPSEGNNAPYVPDLKANLGFNYTQQVADGLDFVADGSWDHTGRIFFDAKNSGPAERDALDLFSGRLALQTERWTLALWGKNLSDERYNSDIIVVFDDPSLFTQAVFKAPPRTYGVELGVRF